MKNKLLKGIVLLLAMILSLLCFASCDGDEDEIDKTVRKLEIDYDLTYCGISLKDLSPLFDEQKTSDPFDVNALVPSSYLLPFDYDNDGDIDDTDYNSEFEITVNLETKKHIDSVYLYYKGSGQVMQIDAGTPFKYEFTTTSTTSAQGWTRVDINYDTQYLNFTFKNKSAEPPYEILVYGYDLGEKPKEITEKHTPKTMGYILGMNGHSNADKSFNVECVGYFRDYKTWTYAYSKSAYPQAGTNFVGDYATKMNALYKALKGKNTECVPCFMFDLGAASPVLDGASKNDPSSYVMYAEFVHQYTLKYGNNPANTVDKVKLLVGKASVNSDLVKWVELGNEPNGEDSKGFTPYQLAALQSAAYDGHCGTITSESGSGVGVVTADPNVKVAMAGLAGIQNRYIKAMCFWLEHNRADGTLGIDAFNVHTYCRKTIEYNGFSIEVGVSPEEGNLAGALADIVEFRDKYYPDKEVWLTEFGWDTNQSYKTEGSSHAYGPYTGRQVQAMWLVRSYFILASIGVDRGAMYMCRDVGDEETSVGKYGTSGVITSNGLTKKDSYYYLYTLKSTMSDMYFVEIVDSGNEEVWIYKFENGQGKTCYAVWCPTADDVRVDNYSLSIGNATKATLTEMAHGQTAGVSSDLAIANGNVSVNVSECPILVFAE